MKVTSWLVQFPKATRREMDLPFMELAPSYLAEIARTVVQRCHDEGMVLGPTTLALVQVDDALPRLFKVTRSTVVTFCSKEKIP